MLSLTARSPRRCTTFNPAAISPSLPLAPASRCAARRPHRRPAAGCVMPSCAKAQIVPNFRIADGFYDAYSGPTIEGCVADCKKMRRMRCTLALVHSGRQKIPPDYRSAGRSARPAATSSPAQAESKLPTGQAGDVAMDKLKLRRPAADSASPPAALQPSALVAEPRHGARILKQRQQRRLRADTALEAAVFVARCHNRRQAELFVRCPWHWR